MIKTDLPLGGSGGGGGTGTVTTTPAGGGTPGKLAKFTGATSIGDSIATESGATISIAGSLSLGSALTVPNGGTGLASGTSGGILGFTGATTLASSVLLTANALVLGGGAGATPTPLGSLGTTTTVLHGNAAGAPTFGSVVLTTDVSGDLPFANLVPATAISVLVGRGSAAGAGDFQEITLGSNLAMTGTVLSATAGGTPGGVDTQVQFNDAGAFGGDAGLVYNKTTDTLTSVVQNITQGTITSDLPQINGTVTWNNAGIAGPAWKLNVTATSANASATLQEWQVGGSVVAFLNRNGIFRIAATAGVGGYVLTQAGAAITGNRSGLFQDFGSGGTLTLTGTIRFAAFSTDLTADLVILRDAANHHAWRNGTSAQRGSIYNTYTSSTNFERFDVDWITTANQANVGTAKGSGGGTARAFGLQTDATVRLLIGAAGSFTITEANDFIIGTTTGTKFGTATTQKMGWYNATPVVQQTSGENLTNNVTSGGTDGTIANYTDLTIYTNDAAAIRNNIYQLARKLKQVNDALRVYGILS